MMLCLLLTSLCSCFGNVPVSDNQTDSAEGSVLSGIPDETIPESTDPAEPHTQHLYVPERVEPTRTSQGYMLYKCECGDSYMEDYTGLFNTKEDDQKPVYKVLFIGNSYTNRSSLWNLVKSIAGGEGYTLAVDYVIKGGWTLLQMSDENDECGAVVDSKLKNNEYDIVFMQEQSERPASSPALFYDGVRALNEKVKNAGATGVLFQTWGRKEGHATLTMNNWTPEQMTQMLAAAYEAIGDECGLTVSPVGSAFFDVYTNHPAINLYDPDLTHPSYAGSYLAALCHYAVIYGKSPIGVSYTYGVANAEEAKILQKAAHKAVFGESIVKEEYKTSSEGVTAEGKGSVNLTEPPTSSIISVGITGDKGIVSSSATAASGTQLTDEQLADLADIGYGVSIIGTKDMVNELSNINNGLWAKSTSKGVRLSFHFADGDRHYDISGKEDPDEKYRALLTYNFGKTVTLDAIGYFSGNMNGFAQAQDVFVSNDGITWNRVESACYDAKALSQAGTPLADLKNTIKDSVGDAAGACALFSMGGIQAKYVRVGIITGITVNDWDLNTLELAVFGNAD